MSRENLNDIFKIFLKKTGGVRTPCATPFCRAVDIVKVDALLILKNPKCHLLKNTGKSFNEITHIGLEPHNFFFLKYLNKYGR